MRVSWSLNGCKCLVPRATERYKGSCQRGHKQGVYLIHLLALLFYIETFHSFSED